MGWHRGKERGAGAVHPDPVWPRGEVFGVDTPTGTGCSRWRSLLICSSACEAAKSAPGGVLQADSATHFWRSAQIPTTRWEMGHYGLLPGERVKMGSEWDSEEEGACCCCLPRSPTGYQRAGEHNKEIGAVSSHGHPDPPVQTRGQVPGWFLAASLRFALCEIVP